MSCQTCGHTMQIVMPGVKWCPRCGTLATGRDHEWTTVEAPKLVERCREFEPVLGKYQIPVWRRLGIEESIHTPEERSNP